MTGHYGESTPNYETGWRQPEQPVEGNSAGPESAAHPGGQQPGQPGQQWSNSVQGAPQYVEQQPSNGFSAQQFPAQQNVPFGPYSAEGATPPIPWGPPPAPPGAQWYQEPVPSAGFSVQQPPPLYPPAPPQHMQPAEQQPFYRPDFQPNGNQPAAFPYSQQTPVGGPAQPPMPIDPTIPAPPPPDDLSRQAIAAAQDLSTSHLLRFQKRPPQSGWRRMIYQASGHSVNLGESPADEHRRELIGRINQPLRGCYKIAMLSLKGGVGKTTVTTTLGSTFASLRGDRVVAVDANPDRGTLSQKIPLETTATVRHLLRDAGRITRYSDVRAYTSQGPSRLEVLASEQDPAVSEAFSEDDYRRTVDLLEHFYNIVLTDCGTGLMHSAMRGVLDIADSLVIVSSSSIDGARSASATLDWLDAHGYHDVVARSVAVINSVRPRAGGVDLGKLTEHFGARCRAVCRIPFDPHLEQGAEIELDQLGNATRLALLELAATVADDFPHEIGWH